MFSTVRVTGRIFEELVLTRGAWSSDTKACLPRLLDEIERGETIITRHGRPAARIVPEADNKAAETRKVIDRIAAFR